MLWFTHGVGYKDELFIYTLTEMAEKTWKSEAVAFITGFSPFKKGLTNIRGLEFSHGCQRGCETSARAGAGNRK
ncbi:hypothetical protein GCM10008014_42480 [Paenibacillus silvae]|uniref:Uncharacterized protein n=1 Tax=Paenibacillus silvae TaxID=1325358 RepID=A0ABQ1ZIK6_9BACL|nr:hypothetical protein GCM10008014_42480 [Paenibacillus silvae]